MTSNLPFDLSNVLKLSKSKRERQRTCCVVGEPLCGSFNRVILLAFDDGVSWAFRTPRRDRNGQNFPSALLSKLIASEAATLNFLARHSTVPVPRVIDYDCSEANIVGVPYILMTCAQGASFASYLRALHRNGLQDFTETTTRFMHQLGKICFELSKLRFSEIGSLFEQGGHFVVRESLVPTFTFQERHRLATIRRGPFDTEQAYFRALNDAFLAHIRDLPLSHHFFRAPFPEQADYQSAEIYKNVLDRWNDFMTVNDKIDSSENRIQYHTAGKIIEEILPRFSAPHDHGIGFPLGHADLSTSNIFVDQDGNITCIIDWEFASTMPLGQLLIPPGLPNQRRQPSFEDCAAFRAGFDHAAATTFIAPQTPWMLTDILWHYLRWVNLDTSCDYLHFEALFDLHPQFAPMDPLIVIDELQNRADIREALRQFKAGDREPAEIESDEDTYFSVTDNGDRQRFLAQKLTEIFEINRPILKPDFWLTAVNADYEDSELEDCPSCEEEEDY